MTDGTYTARAELDMGPYLGKVVGEQIILIKNPEGREGRQRIGVSWSGEQIIGAVKSADGRPVANAYVQILRKRLPGREGKDIRDRIADPSCWKLCAAERADEVGKFVLSAPGPGVYVLRAQLEGGPLWPYTSQLITIKEKADHGGVQLVTEYTTGIDLRCFDAETNQPIQDVLVVCFPNGVTATSAPGQGVVRLSVPSPGAYDLRVSADGYCGGAVNGVGIVGIERVPVEVRLSRGGNLAVTFSRAAAPPDEVRTPIVALALRNLPPTTIALMQGAWRKPNTAIFGFYKGKATVTVNLPSPTSGSVILPGDYAATVYYLPKPDADPVGQFDVRFTIKAGETTNLSLKEAQMQTFKPPFFNFTE